jgi:hypothetical protein
MDLRRAFDQGSLPNEQQELSQPGRPAKLRRRNDAPNEFVLLRICELAESFGECVKLHLKTLRVWHPLRTSCQVYRGELGAAFSQNIATSHFLQLQVPALQWFATSNC